MIKIYNFEIQLWLLIICSGISTLALFLSFPLVNIYLAKNFNLLPAEIGLISGIMPITIMLFSISCGKIVEKLGYSLSIKLGIFINLFSFIVMALIKNLLLFCISLSLIGLGKLFFDNSIRANILALSKGEQVNRFFRLRYLFQNIGNAIGPLIGVYFFEKLYNMTFLITAIFLFSIFLLAFFIKDISKKNYLHKNYFNPQQVSIIKDKKFQIWILSSLFIIMGYGAYEELMPIIILESNGLRPEFGVLVSLNAVTVIISQFILLKIPKYITLKKNIIFGFLFIIFGFLFMMITFQSFFLTIFAVILFSIGESLLFPCYDIIIGNISSEEKRAEYYSVGEIKQIGFFLGPAIGGVILTLTSQYVFFILCIVFSLISWLFLNKLTNKSIYFEERSQVNI